ncbi:acyl transferase domain-containing protein/D-arabinose 1-dehydrogenase-like Zn-dependent alcohol dehydrogenase/acyl carrier protein [Kibdelosporangium banguiense]|uniref:Acyl transferase domain-containing protein/D-arabinose 1-dehydrogenase-like Zn-dependent alcohol dehydrogenase/acyl carrier protein n=1 Tax=Kibdelosporangium banguiense TaxID=1365924 RepID=A0ABS4TXL9_9PSEU|nr:type I polyketide synthase [Kibdelosporangium banguiense]MBP2329148.1 acyl transferase domain-containing protein/D-arabinose 1-dehydrogenase-like Zn-dependent alcohol dehydrogenase/acyl carrier protein [Kibdelosporangium banguiense]
MANDEKLFEYLKRVTAELRETRDRLRVAESADVEPVAIVGMSCRFPGGVSSPDELWDVVAGGVDAVGEFPKDRGWDLDSLFAAGGGSGTSYVDKGGFLLDAAEFDAGFFGVSPREALAMDPQQRLLLETSWELFERAGIDPESVRGSRTGVFVGSSFHGYAGDLVSVPEDVEGYLVTGRAGSVVSGRIAYTLGLEGPAVTVDTACSSSLVALHLAARSLRAGESSLAIAGGVMVMATPEVFAELSRQQGLSRDGRCKAFAASADGAGMAEGVGLLLVERLSDAVRNGHKVLAVVRGSAVNQDGASNGLTAPNGPAQQRVIRAALDDADLAAGQVDVVEAHGTGTKLGDPIEADALLATYGQGRPVDRPVLLGSLKSNLGHTQAAAGIAGVIKMVLAMRHGIVPATLHVDEPTPHVDWTSGAVELVTQNVGWPETGQPRRAAVSSFGVSGTNAHVILEQPPVADESIVDDTRPPVLGAAVFPCVVSSRSEKGLHRQAARLHEFTTGQSTVDVVGAGWSSVSTRAGLEHRAMVVAGDQDELPAGLDAVATARPAAGVVTGAVSTEPGGVVFVFPGHGAQWAGMAAELLSSPVFAESIAECAGALAPHVDWDLVEVLRDADALEHVDVLQPALWAVMVSLARVWRALGVTPAAVVGHSQGEVAAACVAGALSIADGARVVALRSKVIAEELTGIGGMVTVVADADRVSELLGEDVWIAARNGPDSTVVGGTEAALDRLVADAKRAGIWTWFLDADYPSHTPMIDPIGPRLGELLASVTPGAGEVPIYSTVTGGPIDGTGLDADHWLRNLSEVVRFEEATQALLDTGHTTFLEVSPQPVLTAAVERIIDRHAPATAPACTVAGTLRRDDGGPRRLLTSLAELWVRGVTPDWTAVFGTGVSTVDLPTAVFDRKRYWLHGDGAAGDVGAAGLSVLGHPLLTAGVALADRDGFVFTGRLSSRTHAWLADHAITGRALLPGAALVELARRAGEHAGCDRLDEVVLQTPLFLPSDSALDLQLRVDAPDEHGARQIRVFSAPPSVDAEQDWVCHASAVAAPAVAIPPSGLDGEWPPSDASPLDVTGMYDLLSDAGYYYGPAFRGVRAVWRRGDEVFAEVELPDVVSADAERFGVHPVLLDSALQARLLVAMDDPEPAQMLPFSFSGVGHHATGATAARVRIAPAGNDALTVTMTDATGRPILGIDTVHSRLFEPGAEAAPDSLFEVTWRRFPVHAEEPAATAFVATEADVAELRKAISAGSPPPKMVFLRVEPGTGEMPAATRATTAAVLDVLRAWLAADELVDTRLVVLTRMGAAVAVGDVVDLDAAAVRGLVRSAVTEHPDRIMQIDVDGVPSQDTAKVAAAALAFGEPEVAVRAGVASVPRLGRITPSWPAVPETGAWSLDLDTGGSLEDLRLVPCPAVEVPLESGEVRVGVRATGVNFRDVLVALGVVPSSGAEFGCEGAGVVLEVGPEVVDLAVGDRVMGMLARSYAGPVAVADRRKLARIPADWSFADAATVPAVFLTAYYALVDVAEVQAGQSLLVHAAAGGVGMAAVQLARHLGAEVYATASEPKWSAVRGLGVPDERIASSRTLEFGARFAGVDVVLNCLTGEFVDVSLDLLGSGGRFVELGKTDIRDADEVAARRPGVWYQAIDLNDAGPDRIQQMMVELLPLFEAGVLSPLPVTAWDVRQAPEAFRYMSQAKHTGKVVLTAPLSIVDGTVLVTGGTGAVGSAVARHLVRSRGVRRLVLASRLGVAAPSAAELADELGAAVRVVSCDVADRAALKDLLAEIPDLTGVVHAAGVLDDGVVSELSAERLDTVFRPKVDAAWHLHELTRNRDLGLFAVFSSAAAVFGAAGQGNYVAANAFLDALAHVRRGQGLAGHSLAWGLWGERSALTGGLGQSDVDRMARSGIRPLDTDHALALFDTAVRTPLVSLVPAHLDMAQARASNPSPLLRGSVRTPVRRARVAVESGELATRLAALPVAEGDRVLIEMIRAEAAILLGHAVEDVTADRPFKDLGFDSLTSVELRNRLGATTGLRLPATLVFDHPSPAVLAWHLRGLLAPDSAERPAPAPVQTSVRAGAPADDAIAIVAMSCRFPGGVDSPADLWRLLLDERDAMSGFPTDRGWDLAALFDPDKDKEGTSHTRVGGFLTGATDFDADFFGISPREALAMDPQQRLLLETAWEAFESAGIDPGTLRGTATGVFVGGAPSGYGVTRFASGDGLDGHLLTGNASSIASGRLAYTFGLEGPAVTIDTACSSSLVALHLAAQSLRSGESTLAIAGGVTVMPDPGLFVSFSRQHGLAEDGRCKAFSDSANGTGFAEGVGLVLVERLSDAVRNGHRVLALVRGSSVNQDGASNGLIAPNGPAQQRVIRTALSDAGLAAADVDVVEAHGTGTALGDPIEAQAILATYGQDRDRPVLLGSVKSNLGHTQSAAGIAGLFKMVLAMRHGVVPATLHVDRPTTQVDWTAGAVDLVTASVPWPDSTTRRAAVSSFGISGTNAHVILEQAPEGSTDTAPDGDPEHGVLPWVLSARNPAALRAQAERLSEFAASDVPVSGAAWELASARAALAHRAVVLASDRAGFRGGLATLASGSAGSEVLTGVVSENRRIAFSFAGQGSQRAGMGRALMALPAYRDAFDEVCAEFARTGAAVREAVLGDDVPADTLLTQAGLFAFEVALFRLMVGSGIVPDYLIGHSVGEFAAAHVAGVLSLADAVRVVAARGRLMRELPEGGVMAAIQAGPDETAEWVARDPENVAIAAINSPTSVVVSGARDAVQRVLDLAAEAGHRNKFLSVAHAFHSPLVEPMLDRFAEVLADVTWHAPRIPIVSTVTGQPVEDVGADYWIRHARDTVRFADGLTWLTGHGVTDIVEIGPDATLTTLAADRLDAVATTRPGDDEITTVTRALAHLYVRGSAVTWPTLRPAPRVDLPTYAFQRERYWPTRSVLASTDAAVSAVGLAATGHPLLGASVALADGGGTMFSGKIAIVEQPWLADHIILGTVVLPGAAMVEFVLLAGEAVGCSVVEELTMHTPLVLSADEPVLVQVVVGAEDEDGRRPVSVHTRHPDAPQWTSQASGVLTGATPPPPAEFVQWPPPGATPVDVDSFYDQLAATGTTYGPVFQGLSAAWRRDTELFAEVVLRDQAGDHDRFGLHPAVLDAALQGVGMLLGSDVRNGLPFSWAGVRLHSVGATTLRVRLAPAGPAAVSLTATDEHGSPVITADSVALRPADPDHLRADQRGALFSVAWTDFVVPADAQAVTCAEYRPDEPADGPVPDVSIARCPRFDGVGPEAARAATHWALDVLRSWTADTRYSAGRLAVVTVDAGTDPAGAAVQGLVRAARAEYPDRITLIDVDTEHELSVLGNLVSAAVARDEPELAVSGDVLRVPRLTRVTTPESLATPWDPDGTVLITGGTGALGAVVARHLAERHGVQHLLLVSRQGEAASGVTELVADLAASGCAVTVAACDVADRDSLAGLLNSMPEDRPLRGIVHAAGVVDDGVVSVLTDERVDTVLRPKVDAAWHLHELTAVLDLTVFVLFSSAAGVLGAAGQASYAAANSFLDGLARHRAGLGLPARSLAWGMWEPRGAISAGMTDQDLARLARSGLSALSAADGVALLDTAMAVDEPVLVPLRVAAVAATVPAVLRDVVRATSRPAARRSMPDLRDRLRAMAAPERDKELLDLVRRHVGAVLGHSSPVDVDRAFTDLGFDSLTALELRDHLTTATGVRLPATLVFDHPTPLALVERLRSELVDEDETPVAPVRTAPVDEPVAIIGMSCRFPGGVHSPADLWRLVLAGQDAITPFPADRGWDEPGGTYVRTGGFLHDAAEFDAGFFGISPREALAMDPQQRLLLETSWEAFEHAGIDPTTARGSRVGVFAGLMHHDYASRLRAVPDEVAGFLSNGNTASIATGRVAYAMGFEGPAVTVDTACSSSLVALHMAAQALRKGECSLALAGGVTVMSTPAVFDEFDKQGGMAGDGRCKPFAAAADGTTWGEGVGLLLVERMSDAIRNGHQVLAVVRGSALNQDGASNGLTAPNGPSQQRVIRQALNDAGVSAAEVDVVEAHGTGTTLGDPIEAQALLATYGQDRSTSLLLGSVKSNFGHTQAAAGAAGVIKMVMAMRHGVVPQTLNVDEPTPHVDWTAGAVELATDSVPWPETGRARRAAVSSFGISGTNAHVILEQAPAVESTVDIASVAGPLPWMLSARSESGLRGQAVRMRPVAGGDAELTGIGWSLASSRAALERRAVVISDDRDGFLNGLDVLAAGEQADNVISGAVTAGRSLAMSFSGQGSQRSGMGSDLMRHPVFRDAFAEACAAFDGKLDRPLRDVMLSAPGSADADLLHSTAFTQAGLFAFEVAMFRLLTSCGPQPGFLIGHSVGELAAAHVSGVLSLADAATVVAARGRLMGDLPPGGAMASIQATQAEATDWIAGTPGRVSIAAVNGPASVVVSGDADAVQRITGLAREAGRRTKALKVSHAFHSPLIEPMLAGFAAVLDQVTWHAPRIPIVSTLTGGVIHAEIVGSTDYWIRHVRDTVRFADGLTWLTDHGVTDIVEIGPDMTLTTLAADHLAQAVTQVEPAAVATSRSGEDEAVTFLRALAHLHVRGEVIEWPVPWQDNRVDLPTYAFQRERYWLTDPEDNTQEDTVDTAVADDPFWAAVDSADPGTLAETLGATGEEDRASVLAVLPMLADWRRHGRTMAAMRDLYYRVEWRPVVRPDGVPAGRWLVVTDDVPIDPPAVSACLDALARNGITVVRIAEADPVATAERVQATLPEARGVLSLLALSGKPSLAATDALVRVTAGTRLWCVTQGAVTASAGDVPDPEQAQVWGYGRVAALEHPDQWGGLIDLPGDVDERVGDLLCALLANDAEDQLAIRPSGVLARRLTRTRLPAAESRWSTRGAALVIGGTGALGAHIARWLAERGAEHLVLTSRRGSAAPEAAAIEAELNDLGAKVTVAACDVADRDAVTALVADLNAAGIDVRTVVHAAGIAQTTPIVDTTPDEVTAILSGKAGGADTLDALFPDVDAFVLLSSNAGVWGGAGQGAYAAANAHLDALAQRRRARGLAATSIAWGSWAGDGMAARDGAEEHLRRRGVRPLAPDTALAALAEVLAHDETFLAIADVDWSRFGKSFTALRPSHLLDEIPGARQEEEPAQPVDQRLVGLPDGERRQVLAELVRTHAAAVLGYSGPGAVEPGKPFRDLGFDSLAAVEFRTRLTGATGLRLPATAVFDYPTPRELADHLAAELGADDTDVLAEIDRLESRLAAVMAGMDAPSGVAARLTALAARWGGDGTAARLDGASRDEVFDFIDNELGI